MSSVENSSTFTLQIVFALLVCCFFPGDALSGEENLRKMIPRNAQLIARPVESADESVPVELGVTPIHINEVDEVNGVLTITVWISQNWNTTFRWEENQFDGVKQLVISGEGTTYKIWHPDITLMNSVGESNYMPPKLQKELTIKSNGEIFWWSMTTLKTPCNFKNSIIRCDLVFGSWQHTGKEIDVRIAHHMDPLEYYQTTGLWQINEIKFNRREAYYHCCPDPYTQAVVQIEMSSSVLNTPISSLLVFITFISLGMN